MSCGYIIASVDITNQAAYDVYKKLSTEAIRLHGAEVLVRGGEVQTLEGGWNPGRTVVLKFPSVEAAKIYWDSPEYRAARAAREGACTMRMVVVEGA